MDCTKFYFVVNLVLLCYFICTNRNTIRITMENSNIEKPRVAIAAGNSREQAVRKALKLVRDDIAAKVSGSVLIKPNFLSSTDVLASTQAEAVLARSALPR